MTYQLYRLQDNRALIAPSDGHVPLWVAIEDGEPNPSSFVLKTRAPRMMLAPWGAGNELRGGWR
jgi:hypothetical protein